MSIISSATRLLLALSMLKGVGPAALRKTVMISGFEEQNIDELAASIPQIARAIASGLSWQTALDNAEKQIEEAQRHQARILSPLDNEYPKLLAATKDDPFLLYVQGKLAKVPEQSVAIIGTRKPTQHGKAIAARITQFFVKENWSIISGLAIGCDAIAHQSALDAGGHTVAVLAHGLHMIAPSQHKKLAQDILSAGGALVSEYPFGQGVQNSQYVKRDRTQAGMAQGVVMVQSDIKGGSLHASRASLDYGRWLAIPYPTDKDRENMEPKIQANLMIADGADAQRTDLLRCPPTALKHIQILHSREDYLLMTRLSDRITFNKVSPKSYINEVIPELSFIECSSKVDVSPNTQSSSPDQCADLQPLPEFGSVKQSPLQIPSCEEIRHCVVLSKGLSVDLRITQMPSENSKEYEYVEALINNKSILIALSTRLEYIQTRLDAINMVRNRSEQSISGDKDLLLLHFSVEDVVLQMKRAVDLLHLLERTDLAKQPDLLPVGYQGTLGADGTDAPLTKGQRSRLDDISLSETLEDLLDSFSHWFVPAPNSGLNRTEISLSGDASSHDADDLSHKYPIVEVYLGDLVCSFNSLIARTLLRW